MHFNVATGGGPVGVHELAGDRPDAEARALLTPYWHALGVAAVLAALAVWNGSPLLYEDTQAYIGRPARMLADLGPGWLTSEWEAAQGSAAAASDAAAARDDNRWMAGRSPFWGITAYVASLLANSWGIVAMNALLTGVAISLFWFRGMHQRRAWPLYAITALLLVPLSAAGVFVALLTPDALAAVMTLLLVLVIARWRDLRRLDRIFAVAAISFAVLSHNAFLMLATALVSASILWWALHGRRRGAQFSRGQLAALVVPLLVGAAGVLAFDAAAKSATGHPPLSYPFLTARFVKLDVGRRYLDQACPGYHLCKVRERLPIPWNVFLFRPAEAGGIYKSMTKSEKQQLGDEQFRFVVGVIRSEPLGVARSLAGDGLAQIVTIDLEDIRQAPKLPFFSKNIPAPVLARAEQSRMWLYPGPLNTIDRLQWPGLAISLAAAAAAALRARALGRPVQGKDLLFWILAGVVFNALVCGMLVSPWARFQARIIWLVVFGAAVFAVTNFSRSREGTTI